MSKATVKLIFDKSAAHMLTQNQKSRDNQGYLCYQGVNGDGEFVMCPVGALISASNYIKAFEWREFDSPSNSSVAKAIERSLGFELGKDDVSIIKSLKKIHDTKEPASWKRCLYNLAMRKEIKTDVPALKPKRAKQKDRIHEHNLHDVFSYNKETGELSWKIKSSKCIRVGDLAGRANEASITITYKGVSYTAHHIVWAMHHGSYPKKSLKHVNGNTYDNRIENLAIKIKS